MSPPTTSTPVESKWELKLWESQGRDVDAGAAINSREAGSWSEKERKDERDHMEDI